MIFWCFISFYQISKTLSGRNMLLAWQWSWTFGDDSSNLVKFIFIFSTISRVILQNMSDISCLHQSLPTQVDNNLDYLLMTSPTTFALWLRSPNIFLEKYFFRGNCRYISKKKIFLKIKIKTSRRTRIPVSNTVTALEVRLHLLDMEIFAIWNMHSQH